VVIWSAKLQKKLQGVCAELVKELLKNNNLFFFKRPIQTLSEREA
jgi:hypothetical protein